MRIFKIGNRVSFTGKDLDGHLNHEAFYTVTKVTEDVLHAVWDGDKDSDDEGRIYKLPTKDCKRLIPKGKLLTKKELAKAWNQSFHSEQYVDVAEGSASFETFCTLLGFKS